MADPQLPTPEAGPRVVILADDLTGACDAAQPFAAILPAGVLTRGLRGLEAAGGWRVLGVNARTRPQAPAAARIATAEILDGLRRVAPGVIYKKIDSTLRGNVAAEVGAVAAAFPERPVVVAPAFPAVGRTVVGGRVLVQGVPVDQSGYAADPRHPVREGSLPSLLGGTPLGDAVVVPLEQVRAGPGPLCAALGSARHPARFLCLDAETDQDLLVIARALEPLAGRCLLVGAGGLAGALARTWRWEGGPIREPAPGPPPRRPHLAVVGTRNPVTVRQVEWIRRHGRGAVIGVHPGQLPERPRGVRACTLQVHVWSALDARQDVVLHVAGDFVPGVSASQLLADLVDGLPRSAVGGLVLTGGGTADAVLDRLGGWGIRLTPGPVPAGCSAGVLRGGLYEGTRVMLKAGGFGDDTLLARLLEGPPPSALQFPGVSA